MKSGEYQVEDEGQERKYFTMVPHLIDDSLLSPYAVRLYLRLKRRAGEGGKCWETTANLANACCMSPSTVSRAKRELENAGLIRINLRDRNHGEFPGHIIEIVDIWVDNSLRYSARFPEKRVDFNDFSKEAERFPREVERFSNAIKEEPCEENSLEVDPIEEERPQAVGAAADCEWILMSDPRIYQNNNALEIDDPFVRVTGLIEFRVSSLQARRQHIFGTKDLEMGYFRITRKGAAKIKAKFESEDSIDKHQLAEAVDYWYWASQKTLSDLGTLDDLFHIYDQGAYSLRVKSPEIYRNTPEVSLISEITGRTPPKEIMPAIYDVISELCQGLSPKVFYKDLASYYQRWVASGYKPVAYTWLFDQVCRDYKIESPFVYAD